MNAGATQPTRIPEMADAATYSEMLNEIAYYKTPSLGRFQKYSEQDLQLYRDGTDLWGHPNTDWFHEVFKPYSLQDQVNASISGGTENMKYFLSLGTQFQDGIYRNSATNYKQYNFRTNIDGKISKSIDISFDVSGREEVRDFPTRSAGSIFRMLMRGKPNMPAYWPNGDPGPDIEYGDNPAVTCTSATGYDKDKRYILESNLRTNINIPWVKGLILTANASFDKAFQFQKRFETPWYLYTWDGNADHTTIKGKRGLDAPQLTENAYDRQKITINAYATWERLFAAKHNIKVMAGTERRSGGTDYLYAFRKNYISAAVDQLFAGASDQYMANNGYAEQNAYLSWFGRVNYDLSRKYLLEFVWRYDGSYMFPESKRFGFFPGISAGWRISEENFFKNNLAIFNDFKIRGSWGQTGNDRIDEYQYLTTYGFTSGRTYVFGGNDAKLLVETKIPNPDVTWEIANQANVGFDATLLNNKLTVTADYFNNLRTQILITRNASIPSSTGLTLPPENIGKVKNVGVEGMITYRDQAGSLDYSVSANASYSKNKIIFWDETPGVPEYQKSTGRPMGSSLYYQAIGIFDNQGEIDAYPHWAGAIPGDVIFEDVNNDGAIDGLDRVMNEKTNLPRLIYGATFTVGYKGFDVAVLFQGATGSQQYINPESGEIGNYYEKMAVNRWTPENTSSTFARTWNRDEEYWRSQGNTYWLYNMNYIRLKNFELGYTLPGGVNKALGMEGIRFYVNGINLLTLSKQKYIDPEVEQGTSYPLQRVVTGGITLTF
jgi:TonB-dependent starch-binding outer membrane protein SusC